MRSAVKAIKDKGITPLMMSLPPIDAERYIGWITRTGLSKQNIVKWLGDVHMIYRFQELYSNTIGKIARETGSFFVDVRSYFLDKHNYKHLVLRGWHPSQCGRPRTDPRRIRRISAQKRRTAGLRRLIQKLLGGDDFV